MLPGEKEARLRCDPKPRPSVPGHHPLPARNNQKEGADGAAPLDEHRVLLELIITTRSGQHGAQENVKGAVRAGEVSGVPACVPCEGGAAPNLLYRRSLFLTRRSPYGVDLALYAPFYLWCSLTVSSTPLWCSMLLIGIGPL